MNRFAAFIVNRDNLTKNLIAFFLLFSVPLASFAQPQQVAEVSAMKSCHYLNKVEGSSGYGKNSNWQILAKDSALNRAEKLGASHVVWERFDPVGAFNGIAVAQAYDCKS